MHAALSVSESRTTFGAEGLFTAQFPGGPDALLDSSIVREDAETAGAEDAEALTGSTRLKAGTTTVLVNAFSTALMMRAGRTWSNLMVQMVATNSKLDERAVRIPGHGHVSPERGVRKSSHPCEGELPAR